MLKRSMLFVGASCLLGAAVLAGTAGAQEKSEGFAFYLKYVDVSAEAKKLADITPFMPSWWKSRYEGADEATQASAVERAAALSRDLRKIALEKEEAVDDGVRLHMTAVVKDDLPMRGEVLLMRESGALTIEELRWQSAP